MQHCCGIWLQGGHCIPPSCRGYNFQLCVEVHAGARQETMYPNLLLILDTFGDTFVWKVGVTFQAAGYKVSLWKVDAAACKYGSNPT